MPLILGLPFLTLNNIVCDYAACMCTATNNKPTYNLLNENRKAKVPIKTSKSDILAALQENITTLSFEGELAEHKTTLRSKFSCIFEPPPHVDELPTEPVARIKLKDPNHVIKSRNYTCPHKWKESWHTLLQQHLKAG